MNFYQKLQELAKDKGVSFKQIEKELNYPTNTLYNYKSKDPSGQRLIELADYFDVTIDYLLGREEKVSPWTATVARATVKLIKPGLPKEETRKLLSQIFGKKAPEIIAAIEQEYYNKPENTERIKSNDDLYQQKEIERDIEKNIDNKN
ncbi:helix-turn-helix domain-containing protein [Lactococcus petauri]|uniref:helix-turn-helix domain-containing protein n=1 Tax=Lactococcus petauri TaxID=1940789 RepID=UPI0017808262|nr:helix-turn-helix transcriptional regulator [Lactococcus petauri]MBD5824755.1 XRE family transcriptional regulator [Lactococcus petauri]